MLEMHVEIMWGSVSHLVVFTIHSYILFRILLLLIFIAENAQVNPFHAPFKVHTGCTSVFLSLVKGAQNVIVCLQYVGH